MTVHFKKYLKYGIVAVFIILLFQPMIFYYGGMINNQDLQAYGYPKDVKNFDTMVHKTKGLNAEYPDISLLEGQTVLYKWYSTDFFGSKPAGYEITFPVEGIKNRKTVTLTVKDKQHYGDFNIAAWQKYQSIDSIDIYTQQYNNNNAEVYMFCKNDIFYEVLITDKNLVETGRDLLISLIS